MSRLKRSNGISVSDRKRSNGDKDVLVKAISKDHVIELNKAQTCIMYDVMEKKVHSLRQEYPAVGTFCFSWKYSTGDEEAREVFLEIMKRFVFKSTSPDISKDYLFISSGATSLLEIISFVLCKKEKDCFVLPSPYYSGFQRYFSERFPCKLVPSPADYDDEKVEFTLNSDRLRKTVETTKGVKGIAICNPNNPLCTSYSYREVKSIVEICIDNSIHLISDEVYANCTLEDDNGEVYEFHSVYSVVLNETNRKKRAKMEKYVHVVYSLSKDYGLSGLRMGMVYSMNGEITSAIERLGIHHSPSMDTLFLAKHLCKDIAFFSKFVELGRARLISRYAKVLEFVDRNSQYKQKQIVKYVKPRAGLYIWVKFLFISTWQQELEFHETLMKAEKVVVLAGRKMCTFQPGWFRIVISRFDVETTMEGIRRVFSGARRWCDEKGV